MHPGAGRDRASHVAYDLSKQPFTKFQAKVALDDSVSKNSGGRGSSESPVMFVVTGDGKELWRSGPVQRGGQAWDCDVDIRGVSQLEIDVVCPGSNGDAHAVWVDPALAP